MRRFAILFALALFLLLPTSAAATECQFVLGFKTLRDLIGHDIVGECLENERYAANGNSEQETTGGLLVWRKADNFTAFTDGYRTWINGPNGLVQRLNTERFEWEADYAPGGGIATPTPTPTPIPVPARTPTSTPAPPHTPTPTPVPAPTPAPTRTRTPTRTPAPTSVPTPAPTPTPDITLKVAAAKRQISALPWVRDGVGVEKPPWWRSQHNEVAHWREPHSYLQKIAELFPEAAMVLVRRPWLRDGVDYGEYQALLHLPWVIAQMDAASALQFVQMPFLATSVSFEDAVVLYTLVNMMTYSPNPNDREVLREALADPLLRGGIKDGYRTRVEYIAIKHRSPEIAAAITSLPWIQDGIEGSEWEAMTVLSEATLRTPQFIPILVSYSWVQDGLTKDEQDRVWELMGQSYGPAPTPTPDIALKVAAAKREISALPWVRDGVVEPPDRQGFQVTLEDLRQAHRILQGIAKRFPEAAMVLVRRPWLRDGVSYGEHQALLHLPQVIAQMDAASALQFVQMPFLAASVSFEDAIILYTLVHMMTYSSNPNEREVLQEALADPLLRGGIKDGYRTRVEYIAIKHRSPEIAAAITSLPWIQDGIEGSEWEAMTVLSEATLRVPQFIPILVSYSWVQDGLTKDEQDRVFELMREYY